MSWAEHAAKRWGNGGSARWVVMLVGLISVVAGIVVLAEPSIALKTLAVITGIFLLADGIIEGLASLSEGGDARAFRVLIAVASVIGGIILIRHPFVGVVALALLLGLWLIVLGAFRLASAIGERHIPVWQVVVAAIEMIAGIVIVASPRIGVSTLAILVAVSFIVRGLLLSAIGFFEAQPQVAPGGPVTAT